ncbi:MAG: CHAT domain-containing protein, partial [Caldilinea sp. CFX5]|nr:CHAT domain-containing protein [Caldilinea sp. CFX5]
MPALLHLQVTDYLDPTRWRWVLSDERGHFLADHTVRLDPTSRDYGGFLDLSQYLDYHTPIVPPAQQLTALGVWIGEQVFGGLRIALWQRRALPALTVQVNVPAAAHELLLRPFELACFADSKSFRAAGVRFVYALEGMAVAAPDREPPAAALRILAAFSLPVAANPLNLRRERYGLQRLVRELNQTRGLAVELRVLQYGATRDHLQAALEEGAGWDIIHLSGHGAQGELLLEDDRGGSATIDANELGDLLDLARARLKLLILDACYSGAGNHAAARAQVGLETPPLRQEGAEGAAVAETAPTGLPSLAQSLAERLGCGVLAMRYPVGDAFATELMLALYEKLLDRRRPLPAALHLALDDALAADIPIPPLAPVTPILVGPLATTLQLPPPPAAATGFVLPKVGLGLAFPPEPPRFVGRLQPMVRASQALAPRSAKRGVFFYGMPGAGKTACALELSYRHEHGRFTGYVWHQAPEAGSDIASALFNFCQDIQSQLDAPNLGLTTALDDPARFRAYTLPRLRALLQQNALLLALDNLESLLTESNQWRDPLWGEVVATLLAHDGPSRVILTSRRLPAGLVDHPRLQVEAIHALSLAESVLLARELPHLKRLFDDAAGVALLRQTLRVVQGHPKLLELADSLAADRAALTARVAAAEAELAARGELLDAFFAVGLAREGETRQADADFVQALQGWTAGVTGNLSPVAALLFTFLCRLEPEDRRLDIVEINWKDFLNRLGANDAVATAALGQPQQGLPPALTALQAAGLLAVDAPDPTQIEEWQSQLQVLAAAQPQTFEPAELQALLAELTAQATSYTIHPGVAESVRSAAIATVLDAADIELGDYHIAMFRRGLKEEMTGGGRQVVTSARRSAPYLLRQARWEAASTLLEAMLQRDSSPATLAFALPLLRRIVHATAGTERALTDAGVLARTLAQVGRTAEAEQVMRNIITQAATMGHYRLASGVAGDLLNLLRATGRLNEALTVAEAKADYTRQAGLGPWTQLADEGQRLQVLNAQGRYEEVLAAVETLRPQMAVLPLESEAEETANPWNVRETLLDSGHTAALYSERWVLALALNAEIVQAQEARSADALAVARTRFNDYGPLLRLGRTAEARSLLLACRDAFEQERAIPQLGRVYGALADLEDKTGSRTAAVRWEEVALGYSYQAGDPADCAISHHNLANYLQRQGAAPSAVLAHRLADAIICYQTQSGGFDITLRNLANADLPATSPSFTAVVAEVEQIAGVRFAALFDRLPRTAPDGDAAIAAVWQLAMAEKAKRAEQTLGEFVSLLQAIAAATVDETQRAQIEALLPGLEEKGWMLTDPVQRIWAGERDVATLTANIDGNSARLV